tara:strand:- start:216 stop:410 length:195 start_codon:yes stop_codon:yes gene_type:complete
MDSKQLKLSFLSKSSHSLKLGFSSFILQDDADLISLDGTLFDLKRLQLVIIKKGIKNRCLKNLI